MPFSTSKGGGLSTAPCNSFDDGDPFPAQLNPKGWRGCGNDVYRYTWTRDACDSGAGQLSPLNLSELDILKLTKTMGFCPHKRCQLDNVSHSVDITGKCPEGLCYTKIENGGLAYGACCFTENAFRTSHLLGFYNKSQATPKPIYRHSRVVLGEVFSSRTGRFDLQQQQQHEEEGEESFINANMVAPGIIATQCPLPHTINDAKRMILEQNVSMWIQLSPFADRGDYTSVPEMPCRIFPITSFSPGPSSSSSSVIHAQTPTNTGISGFQIDDRSAPRGYTVISYEASAYIRYFRKALSRNSTIQGIDLSYDKPFSGRESRAVMLWPRKRLPVQHVWFHGWADFQVPESPEALAGLEEIAERAANVIRSGGTIVVSCVSGRGRSGTFAAMVQGKVLRITTVSELVDVVVGLRRNRDGLVETPRQFRLVADVLGLVPSQDVDVTYCRGEGQQQNDKNVYSVAAAFCTGFLSSTLLFVTIFSLLLLKRVKKHQ